MARNDGRLRLNGVNRCNSDLMSQPPEAVAATEQKYRRSSITVACRGLPDSRDFRSALSPQFR